MHGFSLIIQIDDFEYRSFYIDEKKCFLIKLKHFLKNSKTRVIYNKLTKTGKR